MRHFVKPSIIALTMIASLANAQAHDWPLGVEDQDVDGNRLWDYIEKTKQPMMRELQQQDEYSNAMSDRLQFLMQEGILHINKPEVFERLVNAQVREMACVLSLTDTNHLVTIVSVLETSFSKHKLKSDGFEMITDDMVKAAYNRPDVTPETCQWSGWPRNDHSHEFVKKPVYTGRIVHDTKATP